jgi:hypothetical protein
LNIIAITHPIDISVSAQFMKNFLSIPNTTTQPRQEFYKQSSQFSTGDEGSNGPEFPDYDLDLSENEPIEDLVDNEELLNNDVELINV